MLRERVKGRDRDLIDELLRRLPEWRDRIDIGSLVRQIDPLFVLLAGEADAVGAPVVTSPIWWTRLLAPPGAIEWSAIEDGPWWVSVWPTGGDQLVFPEAGTSRLQLSEAETRDWPRGVWIRWHVRREPNRSRQGPALVRGAFQILDDGVTGQWRARMRDSMSGRTDRHLAGPEWLLREGLYDALIRRCSTLLRRRLPASARFVAYRLMAEAYGDMQRQLSLLAIGHPEAHWAAALARRHVEGSFRAAVGTGMGMEA